MTSTDQTTEPETERRRAEVSRAMREAAYLSDHLGLPMTDVQVKAQSAETWGMGAYSRPAKTCVFLTCPDAASFAAWCAVIGADTARVHTSHRDGTTLNGDGTHAEIKWFIKGTHPARLGPEAPVTWRRARNGRRLQSGTITLDDVAQLAAAAGGEEA